MKYAFAMIAVLGLSACMGGGGSTGGGSGGGGGGVDLTPDVPDATMNSEMGAILNDVRTANGRFDLEYESTIGRAAQIHANDMYEAGRPSILLSSNGQDMGDTLRDDLFFNWSFIEQFANQGDYTVQELFDEISTNGSAPGSGGSTASNLNDFALDDDSFEFFGLGKAGSGSDQYWALLLVDP